MIRIKLYNILLQFAHDSKEQGARELVRKAISIDDIKKIDDIRVTTFVSNDKEVIEKVASGEACLFGHLTDADIWIPFSYETQKKMELTAYMKRDETFGVDGIPYYNSLELRKDRDGGFSFRLSENLDIDIGKNKIFFEAQTELECIVKDINFLTAMRQGKSLCIGKRKVCEYCNSDFSKGLQDSIDSLTLIYLATKEYEINLNKRFGDFSDIDKKAIDELVKIYQGKIIPEKETAWHIWWWQGKMVPFFLGIDLNGEVRTENGTHLKNLKITLGGEKKRYIVPALIMFKRDIWENLYDVDKKTLLEEIEKGEFNKDTENDFTELFLEILSAYDTTKNEKYYDIAQVILDKLMEVNPESDYLKINKLQMIKRKRMLSEVELQELDKIEEKANDRKIICAANILLDNKRKAQKELDNMSDEDKEMFITYPIYNLL